MAIKRGALTLLLLVCTSMTALLSGCGTGRVVDKEKDNLVAHEEEKDDIEPKTEFEFSQKVDPKEFNDRYNNFFKATMLENTKQGKSFSISALPMSDGILLISALDDYYSKRYNDEKIKSDFLEILKVYKDEILVVVNINHIGGLLDNSEIKIGDEFYEYFFIEDEKGEFVKAKRQEVDWSVSSVNNIRDNASITLFFDKDDFMELAGKSDNLNLSFEGLRVLADNKIPIQFPFSKYYDKEFPLVDSMLKEMGLEM